MIVNHLENQIEEIKELKTAIVVDTPNMHYDGMDIKPNILIHYASKLGEIHYAIAYTTVKTRIPLHKYEQSGFRVYTSTKDCDPDIFTDITRFIMEENVDIIVLVSGDGDYFQLLRLAKERNIDVVVIGHERNSSRKYKEGFFFPFVTYTSIEEKYIGEV